MIPEAIEKRVALRDYVYRAVDLLVEQDTINEDLATLKDEVEEVLGKDCAKVFKTLYTAKYKAKAYFNDISKKEEALAQVEILENGNPPSPADQ